MGHDNDMNHSATVIAFTAALVKICIKIQQTDSNEMDLMTCCWYVDNELEITRSYQYYEVGNNF